MTINKTHQLKKLQTELRSAENDLAECKEMQRALDRKTRDADKLIVSIKKRIESFSSEKNIVVSEHALLRHIERVMGISLDDIRSQILTDQVKNQINFVGSGKGSVTVEGFRYIFNNKTIITVEE